MTGGKIPEKFKLKGKIGGSVLKSACSIFAVGISSPVTNRGNINLATKTALYPS
jgi:hypothetical protein